MASKKTDKALINGKIDSKLKNGFEGEVEDLTEEEAEVAKKAIEKLRTEIKRKAVEKERLKKQRAAEKKAAAIRKKNKKSVVEKFNAMTQNEREILWNALNTRYLWDTKHQTNLYLNKDTFKKDGIGDWFFQTA